MIGHTAGQGTRQATLATLALAATLLVAALTQPPRASAEAVEAGSTELTIDRGLFRTLRADGVKISRFGKGTVRGRIVALPVGGGQLELSTAIGWVAHMGGFKLRSGRRVARLDRLVLDTAKRELYARLDGRRMRIAAFPSFGLARAGFGNDVEIARLRLSRAATAVLNRKLDLGRVFRPGRSFAALSGSFQPETDRLESGSMQFGLDPGFVAKLKSLEVDPVPFEAAQLGASPPSYAAPLLSGELRPRTGEGWGFIEGGIRIAKLGAPEVESSVPILTLPTLTWINVGLSLETRKVIGSIQAHDESGQVVQGAGNPIAALDLSGATVQVDPGTRTLSVANARATLEAPVANLINVTFAAPKGSAPVFAAGDPLGTFSLRMQMR